MVKLKLLYGVLAVVFVTSTVVFSNNNMTLSATPVETVQKSQKGKICSDPSVACNTTVTFEPHDLPFRVPKNGVIWETEYFYAIILQSVRHDQGDCEKYVSEADRLSAQALFPNHKVFTSRCAYPGQLFYTNVSENTQFMAVYGGTTKAQAQRMLATVKATGKYPGANIRRMSAGFNGT